MKNLFDQPNYNSAYRKSIFILLSAVTLLLSVSSYSQSMSWKVKGRLLSWEFTAYEGWIGGNYYQIEKVSREIKSESIKMILNEMKRDAEVLDAYLINTDVSGMSSRTLTSLKINVTTIGSEVTNFSDLWTKLASNFENDHPSGSKTSFTSSKDDNTGGYPAKEAKFRTVLPNGSYVYEVVHLVLLGPNKGHLFYLKVDSNHYSARYQEFSQMLNTLKYL